MTGVTVKPVAAEEVDVPWTVDELKAAKPVMVYYFVDGITDAGDDNYKFSSSWEQGCLVEKVVAQINSDFTARKFPIALDADRKQAKNQARIEFWSFTNVKMATVSITDRSLLNPSPFKALLRKYSMKNTDLCAKEIKRLEAIDKMKAEQEKKDETAQK